jgi:segregation and condensation protein B
MSQQDDDTPSNNQNVPTPESHDTAGNRPEPPDPSSDSQPKADGGQPIVDEPAADTPDPDDQTDPGADGRNDPTADLSPRDQIQGAIESILLAADSPLTRDDFAQAFDDCDPKLVDQALERIQLEFSGPARGIHLQRIADGWQLRTNPDYDQQLETLVESKPVNLSRAALETLAIVAYQQPVTRAEIDDIRGVDSSGVIRTLQDWELVRVVGRLDDLGRPHVYGTTDRFLEVFGLEDLTDLPTLSEDEHQSLQELYEDELENFDEEFD